MIYEGKNWNTFEQLLCACRSTGWLLAFHRDDRQTIRGNVVLLAFPTLGSCSLVKPYHPAEGNASNVRKSGQQANLCWHRGMRVTDVHRQFSFKGVRVGWLLIYPETC